MVLRDNRATAAFTLSPIGLTGGASTQPRLQVESELLLAEHRQMATSEEALRLRQVSEYLRALSSSFPSTFILTSPIVHLTTELGA